MVCTYPSVAVKRVRCQWSFTDPNKCNGLQVTQRYPRGNMLCSDTRPRGSKYVPSSKSSSSTVYGAGGSRENVTAFGVSGGALPSAGPNQATTALVHFYTRVLHAVLDTLQKVKLVLPQLVQQAAATVRPLPC